MADRVVTVGSPLAVGEGDSVLSSKAEFLRAVPILAALPERLRHTIASRSTIVRVKAGDWLFRQGDPGDSLYVVRSGRLEVVFDDADFGVGRVLTRGSVVGELAPLTRSPRSASVSARRDSELLRLASADFAALLSHEPRFALSLMRALGRQLQDSRERAPREDPLPATIAIVPFDGEFAQRLIPRLQSTLAEHGTVALLKDDPQGAVPGATALDAAERNHVRVLLVGGDADVWSSFCLRQADRVLVVAGERPPPSRPDPRLRGADVVVCGPGCAPIASAWSAQLGARTIHVVGDGDGGERDVRRLARRLAGRSIGVVLSAGGARGFAHIGVLEELVAAGLEVDRVAGCSMGAFVGGMFAMGRSPAEIRARCREELVVGRPLGDYGIPVTSLLRGGRARSMLRRTFGSTTIEELERDFMCVSCDLVTGAQIVHRRGLLHEAIAASMCLPGLFPPIPRDGRLLVDGGVLDSLPVGPMALTPEGPIVAVDVGRRFEHARPRGRRGQSRGRVALPTVKETLARSIVLGSIDGAETSRAQADLLIEPETGTCAMLDFKRLDDMVAAGRTAALEALAGQPTFSSA